MMRVFRMMPMVLGMLALLGGSIAPATSSDSNLPLLGSAAEQAVHAAVAKLGPVKKFSSSFKMELHVPLGVIKTQGTFQREPDYQYRLDASMSMNGEPLGQITHASDGRIAYAVNTTGNVTKIKSLRIGDLKQLIAEKRLTNAVRDELLELMPISEPQEILAGLLGQFEFSTMSKETLPGPESRAVTMVQGTWRSHAIVDATGNQASSQLDDLRGMQPRLIRLYLDDYTGWPMQLEFYKGDDPTIEDDLVLRFTFTNIEFAGIMDTDRYYYTPKADIEVEDVTVPFTYRVLACPNAKN